MKNTELYPTEDNLLDTMSRDVIDRNKYLAYFYNILRRQESFSTIAIDGRWGCGKTFFVRQMKMIINAKNKYSDMEEDLRIRVLDIINSKNKDELEDDEVVDDTYEMAVYYDAWSNDNDMDPILSIIYEITKQLAVDYSLSDPSILEIAGAIIEAISGHNVKGIIETLKSKEAINKLKKQKDIEDRIGEFFTNILYERGNRLIVFIDELDRCKPTFAVKLLEQIKHYMLDERITFVFSVNLEQLQHTIKHYYGAEFDACRYLDRFFDIRIAMPHANMQKFFAKIGLGSYYYIETVIKRVIRMFNLEMRECSKFYSQVDTAVLQSIKMNKNVEGLCSEGRGKQLIITYIVPLLIGLRIADVSKYNDFIYGRDSEPLKELFEMEDDFKLEDMLNYNESFETEEGKETVTRDEIIERLYKAVFVTLYEGDTYRTEVGKYEFSKESLQFAINVSNMLSNYAELS